MGPDETPFSHVTDQDELVGDEREAYFSYWAGRSPNERLSEVYRLNRLKYGDAVFERGMDKSKMEVIDMRTGKIIHTIYSPLKK